MKKITALLLAMTLAFSFAACGQQEQQPPAEQPPAAQETPKEKTSVRIAGMKGPTTMGMLKLLEDNEAGTTANDYQFTLVNTPDEVTGSIIKGEYDIAAIPANLASVLYNKTEGKVQMAAVNVLNVLYIVEKGDSIQSVDDLKGKTILSTGQGATPDATLSYVLSQNGLSDSVTVDFKSEANEVAALMASGQAFVALLPQPFVTTLLAQDESIRVALDMSQLWSDIPASGESQITTGCVIVQAQFAQEHPEAVEAFLEEYAQSIAYSQENLPEAAALCEKYGIIPKAAAAEKAIPQCGLTYLDGQEMKSAVQGYLEVLMEQNPQTVGGKLPDEGFFYNAE